MGVNILGSGITTLSDNRTQDVHLVGSLQKSLVEVTYIHY